MQDKLRTLVLGSVVVVTNAYWWNRLRIVRKALSYSREYDVATNQSLSSSSEADRLLEKTARTVDTAPEDLPERIATLNEKVARSTKELNRTRERWAASWWDAHEKATSAARQDTDSESDGYDTPVTHVHLSAGEADDVSALAKAALDQWPRVALITGGDGSFAVASRDREGGIDARSVVDDLTETVGGGGGGSYSFASGGGCDPETLPEVATAVVRRLSDEHPFDAR